MCVERTADRALFFAAWPCDEQDGGRGSRDDGRGAGGREWERNDGRQEKRETERQRERETKSDRGTNTEREVKGKTEKRGVH